MEEFKYFENEQEMFTVMKYLKHCNLASEKTELSDAVEFCKTIFECFLRAEHFTPNHEKLELSLYRLGACKYNDAANKFIANGDASIGELLSSVDDIGFPLSAFSQILDTSDSDYRLGWSKLMDGGKDNSWVSEWLNTQYNKERATKIEM